MPTQRKRIGFLPSSEVQKIIDKICYQNKISQSKVTGILVEEALNYRGLLQSSIDEISYDINDIKRDSSNISNGNLNNKSQSIEDSLNLDESSIKEEIQMINDFIEFKFFRNIMNKNKKYN